MTKGKKIKTSYVYGYGRLYQYDKIRFEIFENMLSLQFVDNLKVIRGRFDYVKQDSNNVVAFTKLATAKGIADKNVNDIINYTKHYNPTIFV